MKSNPPNPDDAKLSSLLRESRVAPELPPRFQENVWRRVADTEADKAKVSASWLDVFINQLLRPRLALATVAALVIVGSVFGVREGTQIARNDARIRYL